VSCLDTREFASVASTHDRAEEGQSLTVPPTEPDLAVLGPRSAAIMNVRYFHVSVMSRIPKQPRVVSATDQCLLSLSLSVSSEAVKMGHLQTHCHMLRSIASD
jgi:hypothetical protein